MKAPDLPHSNPRVSAAARGRPGGGIPQPTALPSGRNSSGVPQGDALNRVTEAHEISNVIPFRVQRRCSAHQFARRADAAVFLQRAVCILRDAKSYDRQVQQLLRRAECILARLA